MCGLAGIFSLTGRPVTNGAARVDAMIRQLIHRGPDSQGVTVSGDGLLALGNARLAIVDPTDHTPQPLWSARRDGVISFNGEIYNYREMRRELEGRGLRLRTNMDTEVLLEGLLLEGKGLLERLDGMWAFAFYRPDDRQLLLSRDLLGERHLFYRVSDEELIFASEVAPIFTDAGVPMTLDFHGLVTALRFHAAPPGHTLIDGIARVRPGHLIEAVSGKGLSERRYRRLKPERWNEFFGRTPDLNTIIDVYEETMSRSSLARVPSDVPFVSTLSGGIDSALVCAFSSNQGRQSIDTLYAQSDKVPGRNLPDELDEYEASKVTAERFRTRHRFIRIDVGDAVPLLQRLAANALDGLIDWGVASFEMLGRAARTTGAKVILISDGPDEFLGGYTVDREAARRDALLENHPWRYRTLECVCRSRLARGVLRRYLKRADLLVSPFESHNPWCSYPIHQAFDPDFLRRILPLSEILPTSAHFGTINAAYDDVVSNMDPTQKRALAYAETSIPDFSNLRLDKGFMAASIEARSPYLAPAMVELMLATPRQFRFRDGLGKYILRKIVERRIGPQVAFRSKHGFSAPIWKSRNVRDRLQMHEAIAGTSLFDDFPFLRGAREYLLQQNSAKILWPMYVLATAYGRIKCGSGKRDHAA